MQVANVFPLQKSELNRNNWKYMFSTRKWERERNRDRKKEEEEGEENASMQILFPYNN